MSKLESFLNSTPLSAPRISIGMESRETLDDRVVHSPDNPERFTGTHCRPHADIREQYHRSGSGAVGGSPVAGGTHPVSSPGTCHDCGPDSTSIAAWVQTAQSELVRDYISGLVQAQAVQLDMTYYEQKEYDDLIHRVRQQATNRPLMLLNSTGSLVRVFFDDWLGRVADRLWGMVAASFGDQRVTGIMELDPV